MVKGAPHLDDKLKLTFLAELRQNCIKGIAATAYAITPLNDSFSMGADYFSYLSLLGFGTDMLLFCNSRKACLKMLGPHHLLPAATDDKLPYLMAYF